MVHAPFRRLTNHGGKYKPFKRLKLFKPLELLNIILNFNNWIYASTMV
jgi:hypothetical protein